MRHVLFCPGCQRRLQLPDEAYGKPVQCPSCQRVFTAETALQPGSPPIPTKPPPISSARETIDYDRGDDRPLPRSDPPRDRSRRAVPHRGGEILTFGLLAVLPCPITAVIFGLIAWMMANSDLGEMRSGRMDREGEGLTQAGRALGIVGIILWLVVGCGIWFNWMREPLF